MVNIVMEKETVYYIVFLTVVLPDMNQMDKEDVFQLLNQHQYLPHNQVLIINYVQKDRHSSQDFVCHKMLQLQAVDQDSSQIVQDHVQHIQHLFQLLQ